MKVKGREEMMTLTVTKHAVKCGGGGGSFQLFINHKEAGLFAVPVSLHSGLTKATLRGDGSPYSALLGHFII
jgi:hypothetical protein